MLEAGSESEEQRKVTGTAHYCRFTFDNSDHGKRGTAEKQQVNSKGTAEEQQGGKRGNRRSTAGEHQQKKTKIKKTKKENEMVQF